MLINADGTAARLPSHRAAPQGCAECCGTWYILFDPCSYGDKGDCTAVVKAGVWVCVDAKDQEGQTLRERFGPLEGDARCFTILWRGWCYSGCFTELDDSGLTAEKPPEGEQRVECTEEIEVVATDCDDAACPQGEGYVEAVACDPDEAENGPRIFICAGAVDHRFVFRMVNDPPLFNGDICYCVTPGDGIPAASVPVDAMRIDALDFASTPGWVEFDNSLNSGHYTVAVSATCCGCLLGCASADLRGDEEHPCCCGPEPAIIDYNINFLFRRSIPATSTVITYEGHGSGTSGPYATLPYHWKSTTVVGGGAPTVVEDDPEWSPGGWGLCGFKVANGWPPDAFVDARGGGVALSGTPFDFTDTVTGLNPVGEGDPAGTGEWLGTVEASCNSITITVVGTIIDSEGVSDEVELRIYLFIDDDADTRCTTVCAGPEDFVGTGGMI